MADAEAEYRAAAAEQLVEHVDEHGNVVEIVTRAEMRARGLRHRSVYIIVRSSADEVLVHRRAEWKDVYPGAWDCAFGGVCDVGEGWLESARRELMEEAGIEAELTDHGAVHYAEEGVELIGRLYSCTSDGPFTFDDGEVTATQWVPRAELAAFINDQDMPGDSVEIVLPLAAGWDEPGQGAPHTGG